MFKLSLGALGAVAMLSLSACYGGAEAPAGDEAVGHVEQASTTTVVANTPGARMLLSGSTLYWSANITNPTGTHRASIFQTDHDGTPGSEIELCETPFSGTVGEVSFGAVALAGGNVYFVANYPNVGGAPYATLNWVPANAAAGTSTQLGAPLPYVVNGDLVSDGTSLYLATPSGIQTISLPGGAMTTLLAGTGIQHLALDSSRVYFNSGSSVNRIPKAGGSVALLYTESSTVTSIFTHQSGSGLTSTTTAYFGSAGGAVRSVSVRTAYPTILNTYQNPGGGVSVASVSYDGTRILWGDCNFGCTVHAHAGSATWTLASGLTAASDVQGDATEAFWINGDLYRYTY